MHEEAVKACEEAAKQFFIKVVRLVFEPISKEIIKEGEGPCPLSGPSKWLR
jgi:hypothetical protein